MLLVGLLLLAFIPPTAQAVPSAGQNCYRHFTQLGVSGVINAGEWEGYANNVGCDEPIAVRSATQQIGFTGTVSGPGIIASAGSITQSWSTEFVSGCTFSAFTVSTSSSITSGYWNHGRALITMTSNECHANIRWHITITVLAVVYAEWFYEVPVNLFVEEPPFAFLCDAPGISANSYTPATTCNDPNVNIAGSIAATLGGTIAVSQSGTWTIGLTGIPDTQQELQAIADAIAAGIDVRICPESSPCFHVVEGMMGGGSGNWTFVVPEEFTVRGAWDEWLPIFFFTAVAILAGFLDSRPIRAILVVLAIAGIYFSWLSGAPVSAKTAIALLAAVAGIFVVVRAWRERRAEKEKDLML